MMLSKSPDDKFTSGLFYNLKESGKVQATIAGKTSRKAIKYLAS